MIPKTKKTKAPEIIKSLSDSYGNCIIGKNNSKRIIVSLKLTTETKHRRLGVINLAQKSINITRKRSKHLYRKMNSYGFNDALLRNTKHFDTIRLSDEYECWKIPVIFILEYGEYLHHLQQGFERQRFVSLVQLHQFKVNPVV